MLAIAVTLTGCGKHTLPKDGILGELPATVASDAEKENELKAKLQDAFASSNTEKAKDILTEVFVLVSMHKENIQRVEPSLVDKRIPVEVTKNVGIAVTNGVTIKEVNSKKSDGASVRFEGSAELASNASYHQGRCAVMLGKFSAYLTDKEGNVIGKATCSLTLDGSFRDVYPAGTKGKLTGYFTVAPWNAEQMASLDKIIVTLDDRDDYKEAVRIDKELKDAYEMRNK